MTAEPSTPFPCPGCGKSLAELGQEGVEVAACASCHGVWLDSGALEKRGAGLPAGIELETIGKRVCPRCERPMGVYFHDLLDIDRCQFCQGIYLDPGEIDLLIKARKVPVPAKVASPPSKTRPDAAAAPKTPSFVCDLCHKQVPLEQQVVGETLTVCKECAKKHDVQHDPRARRNADLKRERERTRPITVDRNNRSQSTTNWSTSDTVDVALFALDSLALLARLLR